MCVLSVFGIKPCLVVFSQKVKKLVFKLLPFPDDAHLRRAPHEEL